MTFYGYLHAGRSRFITRNGDAHDGVTVAARIQRSGDDGEVRVDGDVQLQMDAHGRWSVVVRDDVRGTVETVVRGDLATGEVAR